MVDWPVVANCLCGAVPAQNMQHLGGTLIGGSEYNTHPVSFADSAHFSQPDMQERSRQTDDTSNVGFAIINVGGIARNVAAVTMGNDKMLHERLLCFPPDRKFLCGIDTRADRIGS